MRGKIRVDKYFLSTLDYYVKEGWVLVSTTHKDTEGYYWFILEFAKEGKVSDIK